MASLNKVMLIGNLTRKPEFRYTPKGSAICDIGMAINRSYTTDSGEKKEEVTFIDVTFWGKVAEIVAQYCQKGNPLFVEGRLQLDTWEDKATGEKRSKLKVTGENIQLLGSKPEGQQQRQQPTRQAAPSRQQEGPLEDTTGEDIPF